MPSVANFVAAVDKFMALDKTLLNADDGIIWRPGRDPDTHCIKLPLEVEGELRGQSLSILSYTQHPTLHFSISIIFEPAICRYDFHLEAKHTNSLAEVSDGVPSIIKGPHYHSWDMNKRFVSSTNQALKLRNAVPIVVHRQFDAALRWFCGENKILLPGKHAIELPRKDRLI